MDKQKNIICDPKDFLIEKLNQSPRDSKKFVSGVFGLLCIMVGWISSLICILIKPDLAANVVTLATMITPFVAGLTGGILTGQVLFDKTAMNSIQKVDDNDKEEKIAEMKQNGNGKH